MPGAYNRSRYNDDSYTTSYEEDETMMEEETEMGNTVEVELRNGGGRYGDRDGDRGMERVSAKTGAGSVYEMGSGSKIIYELRNVGVNVLSIESRSDIISYLDAVSVEKMIGEQCLLYTDEMGRVFNVVVAGGAEGLASIWEGVGSTFSGWAACAFLPFVARVLAGAADLTFKADYVATQTPSIGLHPGFMLIMFGLVLMPETSLTWMNTSLMVRGANSVGAHVWRTNLLADYPRYLTLILLSLAWFAPFGTATRDLLTVLGSGFGGALVLVNLGARAWTKLNISCIDRDAFFYPFVSYFFAMLAGFCFPYIGMRSVTGGCSEVSDDFSHPNGSSRRARQLVTVSASATAAIFAVSDLDAVQEALGFAFKYQGTVNLSVGLWWILSTIACMAVCHRLDSTKGESAQPFLTRDETSPVGWCVPSLPKIVVDPNYRGKPFGCCGALSDVASVILVVGMGAALIWQGIQQIGGAEEATPWSFATSSFGV